MDAATFTSLAKPANATAPLREPGIYEALARLAEQHGARPSSLASVAARMQEQLRAREQMPTLGERIAVQMHEQLRVGGKAPTLSEHVAAQMQAHFRENSPTARLSGLLAERMQQQPRVSAVPRLSDHIAARWQVRTREIVARSGINDQLAETAREALASLSASARPWEPAATVEALRPIGREGLGSLIEVVADDLEDAQPFGGSAMKAADAVKTSAGEIAAGWALAMAYCEMGGDEIPPDLQRRIAFLVALWVVFGIVLPRFVRLAIWAVRDD